MTGIHLVNEFFIDNIRVDIDRCRLYRDGESVALEPKVIQVLHFLARHQGEVVSHRTLLDAIWTNTVVEPSALQRCIAQLRKAFGDDARQQRVIATFPKRGYSLVAQVIPVEDQAATAISSPHRHFAPPALAAGVLVALLTLGAILVNPESPNNPPADLTTSTPGSEAGSLLTIPNLPAEIETPDDFPVYSPDGRYVVYPRYLVDRKANLWARDLAYGNDFLLTAEAGIYEYLAWSQDSSQLVFVDDTCRMDGCADAQCSSLKSVAISQSETNTPLVQKLIDCSPRRLLAPEWLGAGLLAVIELDEEQASLVQYDLKTGQRNTLFSSVELVPYHLSYSRQTRTITIMALDHDGRKELLFLDTTTGTVNRNNTAVFPEEHFYPSASPY